jgi:uncharacterized protein
MQTPTTQSPRAPEVTHSREDVRFLSGKQRCAAWLYRPTVPRSAGIVVMAHGFGAPREARLDVAAERLAAAGLPTLLFDYRHLGESEGEPRQLVDVPRLLEDWRSAVAYARSLAGVDPDRVALFGTSFGGGHALMTAADDRRIAAVVAQTPFLDGRARTDHSPKGRAFAGLLLAAFCDSVAGKLGLRPVNIPICTAPGRMGVLTTPDALDGFRILDVNGTGLNYTPARVLLQIANYRPALRVREVNCPVLYYLCIEDLITPFRVAERAAKATPKAEIQTYHGGHFDVYDTDGGAVFEQAIEAETAFLQRCLC